MRTIRPQLVASALLVGIGILAATPSHAAKPTQGGAEFLASGPVHNPSLTSVVSVEVCAHNLGPATSYAVFALDSLGGPEQFDTFALATGEAACSTYDIQADIVSFALVPSGSQADLDATLGTITVTDGTSAAGAISALRTVTSVEVTW